jgi:hypothetical protein
MRNSIRQLAQLALLAIVVGITASEASAQVTDSGSVSLSGAVSAFVEIRAGGAASLAGNSGGGITSNKSNGQALTGMAIDLGELGPVNSSGFVTATVPLRLRSNVAYTLAMSTTGFTNADSNAIQPSDVGFGVVSATRDSGGGVNTSGTDTIVAAASGDPSADADATTSNDRWDFATQKSLSYYTTSRTIVSGERIMNASVPGGTSGLIVNTAFAVKPQFFAPGSFSTTVTFTITNP